MYMRLRPLAAWALLDIHVTEALVNPFTSDAAVEPTLMCLWHVAEAFTYKACSKQ